MAAPDGTVLILGGTGEARALAAALVAAGVPVVSSLAGRVRDPALPVGEVRIGGFGGVSGLAQWLSEHRCGTVVDATHPFAQQISRNAVAATTASGARLVTLRRPAWTPGTEDRWVTVPDIHAAAAYLGSVRRRVFLTTGRQDVDAFADNDTAWFLIRVVDPPDGALPPRHHVIRSRGPYVLDGERQLMVDNEIDTLVTKNSGGELTRAKLRAAAELGLEVVMVDRPPIAGGTHVVDSVDAAEALVTRSAD